MPEVMKIEVGAGGGGMAVKVRPLKEGLGERVAKDNRGRKTT